MFQILSIFYLPVILIFDAKIIRTTDSIVRGKSIPLQAWTGPEGSKEAEDPRFQDNRRMKVVRLSALHTVCLYPRKYSWYSFLLEAESSPVRSVGICQ